MYIRGMIPRNSPRQFRLHSQLDFSAMLYNCSCFHVSLCFAKMISVIINEDFIEEGGGGSADHPHIDHLTQSIFRIASNVYSISDNCVRVTILWRSGKSIGLVPLRPGFASKSVPWNYFSYASYMLRLMLYKYSQHDSPNEFTLPTFGLTGLIHGSHAVLSLTGSRTFGLDMH